MMELAVKENRRQVGARAIFEEFEPDWELKKCVDITFKALMKMVKDKD